MKFMSTWTLQPQSVCSAAQKYLAGAAEPPAGVTLLGRWHSADLSGGFALYETDNAALLHLAAAKWAETVHIDTVPVIEDAEANSNLAAAFGK